MFVAVFRSLASVAPFLLPPSQELSFVLLSQQQQNKRISVLPGGDVLTTLIQ